MRDGRMKFVRHRMFVATDADRVVHEYIARLHERASYDELEAVVADHLGTEQVASVPVLLFGRVMPLFYDELAALKGRPFNVIGTEIVRYWPRRMHPRAKLNHLQVFGPVVFFDKIVWH
jgi:hypothetical protein